MTKFNYYAHKNDFCITILALVNCVSPLDTQSSLSTIDYQHFYQHEFTSIPKSTFGNRYKGTRTEMLII